MLAKNVSDSSHNHALLLFDEYMIGQLSDSVIRKLKSANHVTDSLVCQFSSGYLSKKGCFQHCFVIQKKLHVTSTFHLRQKIVGLNEVSGLILFNTGSWSFLCWLINAP